MWKSRDPIPTFTTYLQQLNMLTSEKLAEIETRVSSVIDEAVAFAENSPDPDPFEATTDLYA
jgi:pyruvate dehydrogenase E1 component alpha subunit